MIKDLLVETREPEHSDLSDEARSEVELSRRAFVQLLGTGLLITATEGVSVARQSAGGSLTGFGGRGSRESATVAARLHINQDGIITVMTGKVEEGQGARAQLTQAAAEELRVGVDQIRLIMADTALVPDDGITAGSRTTPSTVPAVRQGAATARELLTRLAAKRWNVDSSTLDVHNGTITHRQMNQTISYAELAKSKDAAEIFKQAIPSDVTLTPVSEWKVLGTAVPRPNSRDLVTGAHRFPSDIVRPNMLYGKILRPPSYGATLESIDLSEAQAMKDVVVVRDGQFVGCAAPSSFRAAQAMETIAKTASWKTAPHPSSKEIFAYLKKHAGAGRPSTRGSIDKGLADASKVLSETYQVAYIQHVPMEPRAAVAEWNDGNLTVWAGIDWPQRRSAT